MSERYMLGVFEDEAETIAAVNELRSAGYEARDVYAPYPVHGLDRAMGVPPSRLGWVCALAGFLGAGSIFFFQYWASAVAWSLNIGGKPFFSLPAFIPITFEVGVLMAALFTVLAFMIRSGLYPGKNPALVHAQITDHGFVILLEEKDAAFDRDRVREIFSRHAATSIEEWADLPGERR